MEANALSRSGTSVGKTVFWWEEPDPEIALARYLADRDNTYDRWKFRSVCALIPAPQRTKNSALDYGCGGGEFTVWLAKNGWRVAAGDASVHALEACRLHARKSGVIASVSFSRTSPPDYWDCFAGRKFELILAKDVMEHIADDAAFLRGVKEHLSAEGAAVIVTQNDHSWNYLQEAPVMRSQNPRWCGWDPTHLRFYNKSALKEKLRQAKLAPVGWRSAYLMPYRAWNSPSSRLLLSLVDKTVGNRVFHFPEALLGGRWPFNAWGWSLAVKCRHDHD